MVAKFWSNLTIRLSSDLCVDLQIRMECELCASGQKPLWTEVRESPEQALYPRLAHRHTFHFHFRFLTEEAVWSAKGPQFINKKRQKTTTLRQSDLQEQRHFDFSALLNLWERKKERGYGRRERAKWRERERRQCEREKEEERARKRMQSQTSERGGNNFVTHGSEISKLNDIGLSVVNLIKM